MVITSRAVVVAAFAAGIVATAPARAHGDGKEGHASNKTVKAEQKPFGIAGDPKKVSRTIAMDMTDEMRFHPAVFEVKRGETIRFVVKNDGKAMHEMVIGTMAELTEHAELMRKFPDMEHDEPYMAHIKPGTTGTIVWHFNRAGTFNYACLIPGHLEAGMVGKVIVK